jgi:hypothetical protein
VNLKLRHVQQESQPGFLPKEIPGEAGELFEVQSCDKQDAQDEKTLISMIQKKEAALSSRLPERYTAQTYCAVKVR